MSSSGWHGFVTQSSAPRRRPRTRWATVDCPVQTITRQRRAARRRRFSRYGHALGPSSARSTTKAPRRIATSALDRHGAGEHDVLPAEAVEALAQYLDESCVAVAYGDAQRRCDDGGRVGHVGEVYGRDPSTPPSRRGLGHRIFTRVHPQRARTTAPAERAWRTSHRRRPRAVGWAVTGDHAGRLDLALLAAVENAPPVAAADVLGAWLADALGASDVSFLVVDFSGRALVRLGHAGAAAATRTQGRETAERVRWRTARTGWRSMHQTGRDRARPTARRACSRR